MKKRHANPRYAYNGPMLAVMTGGGYSPDQTPVCPPGTERCGDALPGHMPPCCGIVVKGPTPTSRRRRALSGA